MTIMDTNENPLLETAPADNSRFLPRLVSKALAKGIAWAWPLQDDRRALASLLGRWSAHLGIAVLALALIVIGRVTLTPVSRATVPDPNVMSAVAEPLATPTRMLAAAGGPISRYVAAPSQVLIAREALPHTTVPERVRLEVITYTVQSGDTIFGIAADFGLSPYTIVWSNMETLQGAPWHIQPGLTLFIPPVDGAYHTVVEGETVEAIAEAYEVEPAALFNMWNSIKPGDALWEGQLLVIPNGTGDDFDWEPPPAVTTAVAGRAIPQATSYNGSVTAAMTGATGYFGLPTGSYAVSGWTFADPRNPGHIGLDYRCRLGDYIYASDNGMVIFSGWSGGYGLLVRVDHGNGFETRYAHFDSIWVTAGQLVTQGQVLGQCGTTGWSTGPHLHYEIRFGGVPQNPKIYEP